MTHLHLSCLGAFQATLDDHPVAFRSTNGRALLAYLATEQARAHSRSALAGLLWPDEPERSARKNLSQTLLELRTALGDHQAAPPFFHITPQTIAFNSVSNTHFDVAQFHAALANEDWAQAVVLYPGAFLDDFGATPSDLFDDWRQTTREALARRALGAFSALSAQQEAQGHLDAAMDVVRRWLDLAPWQEEAHRQLMRLLRAPINVARRWPSTTR